MHASPWFTRGIALLCSLVLAGCAALMPPADPRPAEEIVSQAEALIKNKAYERAAELYATATAKESANGRYYLRQAELLEALSRDKEARNVYRTGLRHVDKATPEYQQLQHMLALVCAEHLQDFDTAEDILDELPPGSAARLDITGYLYYQANQYEQAIKAFNQALAAATGPEQKAYILYHAALVYDALKDEKNTVTQLFHAINQTSHLGLIRDVSILWSRVNVNQPLPQSGSPTK